MALGLALTAGLTAPATADVDSSGLAPAPATDLPAQGLSDNLEGAEGQVPVFIQTSGKSALEVSATARSAAAVQTRVDEIGVQTATVEAAVQSLDSEAQALYVTEYTVPGIAMVLDAAALETIAGMPDVVSVSRITVHSLDPIIGSGPGATPDNANSDALTRTIETWNQQNLTGDGIKVAIIDSGLDYTHSDFGGNGTQEDYDAAALLNTMPTAELYDASKYLGGWDFAGPTYDARYEANSIPLPDANPLDGGVNGHGTHVAGTFAGYGVNADGTTFDGDYTTLDAAGVDALKIAPGVAPEVGVYALKVFGDHAGGTALVGEAIDWVARKIVLDGDKVDVVNISIGSDFGAADDPDSAKLQKLVDLGVLPVVSGGNSDDITDIGGAPGTSPSPLTVAASDSGAGERVDGLASFSSRGLHGSFEGIFGPDVAAPGVNIVSAGSGTLNGAAGMSGTSMAAPFTAGVAALVFQANPTYTGSQVKAQIINTATHDVTNAADLPYSPLRVGTGRLDTLAAVTTKVTVAVDGRTDNMVSVGFGVVEVPEGGTTATRTVTVTNNGTEAKEYSAKYLARTSIPGVSYSVSPASFTVAAGSTQQVEVTLSIPDASTLTHTIDPTMTKTLAGAKRSWVSDASGILELTPADLSTDSALRLAVSSAPKPVSAVHTTGVTLDGADSTTGQINLAGYSVNQGTGDEAYTSSLVPLVLGATDPEETFPEGSAKYTLPTMDLISVGASSTAPQAASPEEGVLTFGIVTKAPWNRLSSQHTIAVGIDVNQDNRFDYTVYVLQDPETDNTLAVVQQGTTVIGSVPANFTTEADANVFDSNAVAFSLPLSALGFTADSTNTQISYMAATLSRFAPVNADSSTIVDETGMISFDVYKPAVTFGATASAVFPDEAGSLPITLAAAPAAAGAASAEAAGPQVMLLHLRNGVGANTDIVQIGAEVPTPQPTTDPSNPNPTTEPTAAPTGNPTVDPTANPTATGEPGKPLPKTGASGLLITSIVAAALLASGGAFVVVRRRRMSSADS